MKKIVVLIKKVNQGKFLMCGTCQYIFIILNWQFKVIVVLTNWQTLLELLKSIFELKVHFIF